MNILDSRDFKKLVKNNLLLALILNTLIAVLAPSSVLYTFIVSIVFMIMPIIKEYKRIDSVNKFIEHVDNVLLGKDIITFEQFKEDELSLLQNKVTKLTTMLREKTELLEKEKLLLVDSIADISHQLRTPLTALTIVVESMRKQNIDNPKYKGYCREMASIVKRVDWLVQSLLKIAKLDADTVQFNRDYIEFKEIIDTIMEILAIPMELMDQELVADISGGVEGDLPWLVEAVSNIMKNCHEHMEMGGKLYVTTSENPIYSEIIIRDTGKGIVEEDIPHLFERFYRGKNSSSQSVGIGLALAKMIIVKHNGVVIAKNHEECGAVFNIKFYKQNV